MAKTPAQRKKEQREREKMAAEEREALLLSRQIVTKLYHGTNLALTRLKARAAITEDQDIITRLIHGADRLTETQLTALIKLS